MYSYSTEIQKKLAFVLIVVLFLGISSGSVEGKELSPVPLIEIEDTEKTCEKNPLTGKKDVCFCKPNKINKIAVIIKEEGIYDNEELIEIVSDYFVAVRENLGVGNVGVKKFTGDNIAQLHDFIEEIYDEEKAGFFMLVGDDLPIEGNEHYLATEMRHIRPEEKAGLLETHCSDIALSYLPPFNIYDDLLEDPREEGSLLINPDEMKVSFAKKLIIGFASNHRNPRLTQGYNRGVLDIRWDPSLGSDECGRQRWSRLISSGYELPHVTLANRNYGEIEDAFMQNNSIFTLWTHGSSDSVGMGLNPSGEDGCSGVYTTREEYKEFIVENSKQPLFVDVTACEFYFTTPRENCCWPQLALDMGSWAFYGTLGDFESGHVTAYQRAITREKSLGGASRRAFVEDFIIFGDVLASFPNETSLEVRTIGLAGKEASGQVAKGFFESFFDWLKDLFS